MKALETIYWFMEGKKPDNNFGTWYAQLNSAFSYDLLYKYSVKNK